MLSGAGTRNLPSGTWRNMPPSFLMSGYHFRPGGVEEYRGFWSLWLNIQRRPSDFEDVPLRVAFLENYYSVWFLVHVLDDLLDPEPVLPVGPVGSQMLDDLVGSFDVGQPDPPVGGQGFLFPVIWLSPRACDGGEVAGAWDYSARRAARRRSRTTTVWFESLTYSGDEHRWSNSGAAFRGAACWAPGDARRVGRGPTWYPRGPVREMFWPVVLRGVVAHPSSFASRC